MNDNILHPSHYTYGKIECIDYIIDKEFNFCLGNAIKYITRAGKKENEEYQKDLEKAINYLQIELNGGHLVEENELPLKGDNVYEKYKKIRNDNIKLLKQLDETNELNADLKQKIEVLQFKNMQLENELKNRPLQKQNELTDNWK